jgi:hypothetical protein
MYLAGDSNMVEKYIIDLQYTHTHTPNLRGGGGEMDANPMQIVPTMTHDRYQLIRSVMQSEH